MPLQGVNDALGQAVDALQDAQQAFLLQPLEASSSAVLQQQHFCLAKLTTLIHEWAGQSFGMAVVLPGTGTGVAISINVLASLTLATMLRCLQVVAHGEGGAGAALPCVRAWSRVPCPHSRADGAAPAGVWPRLPMLGVRGLIRKFLSTDRGGEDGSGGSGSYWRRGSRRKLD